MYYFQACKELKVVLWTPPTNDWTLILIPMTNTLSFKVPHIYFPADIDHFDILLVFLAVKYGFIFQTINLRLTIHIKFQAVFSMKIKKIIVKFAVCCNDWHFKD